VVISPFEQREIVPTTDASYKDLSQSLIDCLLEFCEVVLSQVSTFSSCTEYASKEPCFLALVLVLLDLDLCFLVDILFSLLLLLELISISLNVQASAHNAL